MSALELLAPQATSLKLPKTPVRVIGIDLGTTNSTLAEIVWSPDTREALLARCLEVEQPTSTGPYIHVLVPSVVAIHANNVLVGEGAKRLRANTALRRNKDIFYECKNDIGTRRTYHMAPEGFRSAAEIAGKVLAFLKAAAQEGHPAPPKRTVVTVPASFQVAQRRDTLRAAEMAGLKIAGGDLLDEPVAAFLDYLLSHQSDLLGATTGISNLVVFDFGGGTCDVAVFRFNPKGPSGGMEISPLSVSRYHRLGGGDIDTAIVHQVLIPRLVKQARLADTDLSYEDRKLHIEPALLSVAESLKVGLCIEIGRLQGFGKYQGADKTAVVKTQPGIYPCPCPGRDLKLESPHLTAAQFETVLEPFLDTELLYAKETEYQLTCSIFAPLQDALERAGLSPSEVNLCLLVGGSSLIPQVKTAVAQYFRAAKVLTYEDRESNQVAVARGAAYHALALALFNRSLIQPVAPDAIAIRTASGPLTIVPRGAQLPFPGPDRFGENLSLAVPKTAIVGSVTLRVEIVAGAEARPIFIGQWEIQGPVKAGEPLRLQFHYDGNQVLHLELTLRDQPDARPFTCTIENPLTNVVNPHPIRQRIDETEEDLRTGKIPGRRVPEVLVSLADDYYELGQTDKSIFYLQRALQQKGRPDADILNQLGICYGEKGDWARQEKAYREAFAADPHDPAPLFNLALSQFRRKQFSQAADTIQTALEHDGKGPYFVLAAQIYQKLNRHQDVNSVLKEAFEHFDPLPTLDDWELNWYCKAAQMAGDEDRLTQATAEQIRRKRRQITRHGAGEDSDKGDLPEILPTLQKR